MMEYFLIGPWVLNHLLKNARFDRFGIARLTYDVTKDYIPHDRIDVVAKATCPMMYEYEAYFYGPQSLALDNESGYVVKKKVVD
jgi:hypothetical protein